MRYKVAMGYLVICLAVALCAAAQTQHPPVSTIENIGTATVDVPPDYVEFWLHKNTAEPTFVESIRAVLGFGPKLRKELANRELGGYDLTLSAPAITDLANPGARVSARVEFPMSRFSNRETGPALFATLCDNMVLVAEALESQVEGPLLAVRDRQAVEQAAAALATENALPLAQAVAELMNAQITAVDHVAIEQCTWNADPDTKATLPDMRRITCTARVRVTYAFSAPGT